MAAIKLSSVLTEAELKAVDPQILSKMQAFVESERAGLPKSSTLIANHERENQHLKMKLQMSEDFVDRLRNQLRSVEDNLQEARKTYYSVVIEKEAVNLSFEAEKRRAQQLSEEKIAISSVLERRVAEVEALEAELKSLRNDLAHSKEHSLDASMKSESVALQQISLAHREERMKQESEMQARQISTLKAEIERVVNELYQTRRDRTTRVHELESSLEQKTEDVLRYKEEVEHMKRGIEKKDQHVSTLALRIRELRESALQVEEHFQNEVKALNNYIAIQKQNIQEESTRKEQLMQAVQDMQQLLKTAEQAHNDLEETLTEKTAEFEQTLNEKQQRILSLEERLEEANVKASTRSKEYIDQEMERFYPAAATASKVLRTNASFSHISEDYPRVLERLEEVERENERLRQELENVISEAEEQAPLFHSKVMECNRTTESITQLQVRVSELSAEKNAWMEERDAMVQEQHLHERVVKRLEREKRDLSMQVRTLVNSVREARGIHLMRELDDPSDENESPANRIISTHLVTFKDIEELQDKNLKLITALRDLSEAKDAAESGGAEAGDEQLRQDFDVMLRELEALRAERKQNAEQMDVLIKQRDAFQTFANSFGPLNTSHQTSSRSQSDEVEISQLHDKIARGKRSFEEYRQDSERKIEQLVSQNDKYKDELHALKIEETKSSSKILALESEVQSLTDLLEEIKRDNDTLKERIVRVGENAKKSDENYKRSKDELKNLQDELKSMKSTESSLRSELDIRRNHESKLAFENERLARENQVNANIASTVQSLQSYVSKIEAEGSRNSFANSVVDNLQKECVYLRGQLEKSAKDLETAKELESLKTADVRRQLMDEIEKRGRAEVELKQIKAKLVSAEKEIVTFRSGASASFAKKADEAQARVDQLNVAVKEKGDQVTKVLLDLKKAQEDLKKVSDALGLSRKQTAQLTAQVQERDQKLNNLNKLLVTIKNQQTSEGQTKTAEHEKEFEKSRTELDTITKELESVRKENEGLKGQVTEKEDKIKKIALQARQRIQGLTNKEKTTATENEELKKQLAESRKQSSAASDQNSEETLRAQIIQAQKLSKAEKEIADLLKRNALLEAQLAKAAKEKPPQGLATSSPVPPTPTQPMTQTVVSREQPVPISVPVRHPVLPQPAIPVAVAKPKTETPTASIRPLLTGARANLRTTSSTQTRGAATVVPVQPSTDQENASHSSSVATVLPTQAASQPALVVIAPTPPAPVQSVPSIPAEVIETSQPSDERQQLSRSPVVPLEEKPQVEEMDVSVSAAPSEPSFQASVSELPLASTSDSVPDEDPNDLHRLKRPRSSQSPDENVDNKRLRQHSEDNEEATSTNQDEDAEEPDDEVEEAEVEDAPEEQVELPQASSRRVEPRQPVHDSSVVIIDDSEDEESAEEEAQSEEEESASEDEENEYESSSQAESEDGSSDDDDGQGDSDEGSAAQQEQDSSSPPQEANPESDEDIEVIGIEMADDPQANQPSNRDMLEERVSINDNQQIGDNNESAERLYMQAPAPMGSRGLPRGVERFSELRGRQSLYSGQGASQAQSSNYDDAIVPSTPTLGGFAEALNSPRVPQNRFVFTPSSDNVPATLSNLDCGLRVDDTRMDLSQFNERSAPGTPSQSAEEVSTSVGGDSGADLIVTEVVSEVASSTLVETGAAYSSTESESVSLTAQVASPSLVQAPPTEEGDPSDQSPAADPQSQPSQDAGRQQARQRAPIVWSSDTSSQPEPQPSATLPAGASTPAATEASSNEASVRGRRLRVRGARGTARRAQGWRGSRGARGQ